MSCLAQRCRAAAEDEGAQARALSWRGKSEPERPAAFEGLMGMPERGSEGRYAGQLRIIGHRIESSGLGC